jgi:hypothetical protein
MLRRALAYGQKIFGLDRELGALVDKRTKPQIPARVFARALLILWLCRVPSFHALEAVGRRGVGRRFLRHGMPGADQLANISEILDVPGLRATLQRMYKRLVRNKVLQPFRGHRLAVIDGHEINASYRRCCPACQKRRITVNGQKRIQYYHRVVVLMLVGPNFHFLLDLELLRSHDDEGSAALRLLKRVLKTCPRSFDILLGDGLYPQARLFKLLRRHGKHAIAVLKDERRDVMTEARALFGRRPKSVFTRGKTHCRCWDVEDIDSWESFDEKVRVVRSMETTTLRSRLKGRWQSRIQTTEWVWVTTLPAAQVPTETLVLFGHERWRIENEAFNELSNLWNADHYFHHHPNSIVALWLLLFIAHALFHCFLRNLKPCIRHSLPVYIWAQSMLAEFLAPLCSSA